MFIYLAVAIDKNRPIKSKREKLLAEIFKRWPSGDASLVVFSPADAFTTLRSRITESEAVRIEQVNERALEVADIMVILYQPGIESWGVPIELDQFHRWDRPAFLFLDDTGPLYQSLSLYLRIRIPQKRVLYSTDELVQTLSEYV